MEPLSLIVEALIAGATGGLGKAADKTVMSRYEQLVNRLSEHVRKAFSIEKAIQVEAAIMNIQALKNHKDHIAAMLRSADADQDNEIIKLAKQLLKVTGITSNSLTYRNPHLMERQDNDINEIALSLIPGMGVNESFDVFLSHNSQDKPMVRQLANALQVRGLKVWLDEWELVPGRCWQEALEEIIQTTRTAAVLIGKDGLGPWENPEMRACLSEFVDRHLPVIPVLLPDAPVKPDLPLFLRAFTWVDLRSGFTEAGLGQLQWGITGFKHREDGSGSMQEAEKAQRKQSQSLRSAQDRLRLKAAQAESGPASTVVNVDAKNSHDAMIIGHVGGSVSIDKTK